MIEACHEIDGYKVRLSKREDLIQFRAEAKDDVWGRYYEAFATTAFDALCKLAAASGIEQEELLMTFGVQV